MYILGIESSCDETAVSVVKDGREVLSNEIFSQIDIHTVYGGVVPEIASRAHTERISALCESAIKKAGISYSNLSAIAVTYAPGLIGALIVGLSFAKGLAYSLGIPLVPVHHIRGHVAANYLTYKDLKPPFVALVVSGGHSHILTVKDYTDYSVLGRTRDDAVGEAFDKVARVLGLGYPGGPKLERLALEGDPTSIPFPKVRFADSEYDFSFSGVKTAVINYVHKLEQRGEEINKANVAASFSKAVTEILTEKAILAARRNGNRLVLAGGVSANLRLRELLAEECQKRKIDFFLPEPKYCGDNAAMIASQGYYEFVDGKRAALTQNAFANADIGEISL